LSKHPKYCVVPYVVFIFYYEKLLIYIKNLSYWGAGLRRRRPDHQSPRVSARQHGFLIPLAIFLSVLLTAIMLRLPVTFALFLSSIALMLYMSSFSVDILAQSLMNGVDSFPLLAIPFFLIAGEVMSVGGLSSRIVRMATIFVGHREGGLGYVAIFTSVLLAGLSGSAVAHAAAFVSIL